MSEQIKLKDGSVFEMVPMGISESEKKRIFKFTSVLTYEEIKVLFSSTDNISSIDYIVADGTTNKTYADCVSFKGLSYDADVAIEDGITADVYTVTLSTDAVEKALQTLSAQLQSMKDEANVTADALEELIFLVLGGMANG